MGDVMVATNPGLSVFSFQFLASENTMRGLNQEFLSKSRSYQDLVVWRKALELARKIYAFTQRFPKEETYGLIQQARRAAVSISANIAEGQARNGVKEFVQFLGIANGSLAELRTYLYLSAKLKFSQIPETKLLVEDCDEVARLLNSLKSSLLKTKN